MSWTVAFVVMMYTAEVAPAGEVECQAAYPKIFTATNDDGEACMRSDGSDFDAATLCHKDCLSVVKQMVAACKDSSMSHQIASMAEVPSMCKDPCAAAFLDISSRSCDGRAYFHTASIRPDCCDYGEGMSNVCSASDMCKEPVCGSANSQHIQDVCSTGVVPSIPAHVVGVQRVGMVTEYEWESRWGQFVRMLSACPGLCTTTSSTTSTTSTTSTSSMMTTPAALEVSASRRMMTCCFLAVVLLGFVTHV
eukprot:gnl/TRDRNA2_/TRDRNA2_44530_c0_seq1.p1 gnl/TRDRNA2_/TRDRNA2_44530_c0~~gnl/TRDRNA2_/TRDRNA2_44530_c0_seq1.p1  ORF type:complete len:250 (-),score=30.48 gnl/TRDRNA2_/TRDRNA2_44530_c0_seq1:68-817(-)